MRAVEYSHGAGSVRVAEYSNGAGAVSVVANNSAMRAASSSGALEYGNTSNPRDSQSGGGEAP